MQVCPLLVILPNDVVSQVRMETRANLAHQPHDLGGCRGLNPSTGAFRTSVQIP